MDPDTMVYRPDAPMAISAIECPDVFLMGDEFVLIAGLFCSNEYWVGRVDAEQGVFSPLSSAPHALLDYGNFYAAKTGTVALGENGSIPRELALGTDHLLRLRPVDESERLRGADDHAVAGSELQLMLDCALTAVPKASNVSLRVLQSADGAEFVEIGYSFTDECFYVDHTHCCGAAQADAEGIVQTVAFAKAQVLSEQGLSFNVLLDRSVIESFFNEQKVITSMLTPSNATAPEMRGVSADLVGDGFQCNLQSWQLAL